MVIRAIGIGKVMATYRQQSVYAERAAKINLPKTYQVGAQDQVNISREAASTFAAAKPAASVAVAEAKPITYDDPRRVARKEREERPVERVERTEGAPNAARVYEAAPVKS